MGGSRPREITQLEICDDLNKLLFISKFIKNKKDIKKERKILKMMVEDFNKNEIKNYIKDEVDDEEY